MSGREVAAHSPERTVAAYVGVPSRGYGSWLPGAVSHLGWRHAGSGEDARVAMLACLRLLLALRDPIAHQCEYTRTPCLALLTWSPIHSRLSGAAFTNESNEANVARLGELWARHPE